jgi:PAS domain S-box-containing protein
MQERPDPRLSPREQQLILYASQGLTDTAIALRLGISEATVGTYWGRVRIKYGPYSRTELVAIMMRAEREEALETLRRENEQLIRELQVKVASGNVSMYRELLENAPDAMFLVRQNGEIDQANIAALELFGYTKDELVGRDIIHLVPLRFREQHGEHREEYVRDPQRRQMGSHLETPALRKDGTEFLIRASLSAINTPNGLLITCAIRAVEPAILSGSH